MKDLQAVVYAIQGACMESEYFQIISRYLDSFGFQFEQDKVVCDIGQDGMASCRTVDAESTDEADIWFEMPEEQLIAFSKNERDAVEVKVTTSNPQRVPLTLQMLALRVFQQTFDKQYAVSDREALIYPALFSFSEPEVLWESKDGVRALCYPEAYEGMDVYVSSGFSNPTMKPAALESEDFKIMGYGYELILFALPSATFLRELFSFAVQSICETKHHIMRDHWVRFDDDFPLDTGGLAGMVTVMPTWVPEYFPLQNGVVFWNLLVGVDGEELDIAVNIGVEAGLLDKWDAEERGDATLVS